MEIRDVVGNLREALLQVQLEVKSLRSQVDMMERFTWNLLTLLASGEVDHVKITFDQDGEPDAAPQDDDPTLF